MTQLEQQILNIINNSLGEVMTKVLKDDYSSPLRKLCGEVFEQERDRVTDVLKKVMGELVASKQFEDSVREEFNRKIAKSMVGFLESQIEKSTQEIKQNPTLRAKMIIALENIIEEYTNK